MPAPLSNDMEIRIIKARERGDTMAQITREKEVNQSTIVRLLRLYRETGSYEARPLNNGRKPKLNPEDPIYGKIRKGQSMYSTRHFKWLALLAVTILCALLPCVGLSASDSPITCQVSLKGYDPTAYGPITAILDIQSPEPITDIRLSYDYVDSQGNYQSDILYKAREGNYCTLLPPPNSMGRVGVILGVPEGSDASHGLMYFYSQEIIVPPDPNPLSGTLVTDKQSVCHNQIIQATMNLSGGSPPYQIKGHAVIIHDNGWDRPFSAYYEGQPPRAQVKILNGVEGYFVAEVRDAIGRKETYQSEVFTILPAVITSNEMTLEEKVEEVVQQADREAGSTQYDKALWLHDYLITHTKYDFNLEHYWADDVLLKGTGVCNGYASAYHLLLEQAGIPSMVITGDTPLGYHAWNLIQIDGQWYHVDVTMNDTELAAMEWQYHKDFLVSDDLMSAREWNREIYPPAPESYPKKPLSTSSQTLRGDANNDNHLDINDLVAIIDCIINNIPPASPDNADTNYDHRLDMEDLLWIINAIL